MKMPDPRQLRRVEGTRRRSLGRQRHQTGHSAGEGDAVAVHADNTGRQS